VPFSCELESTTAHILTVGRIVLYSSVVVIIIIIIIITIICEDLWLKIGTISALKNPLGRKSYVSKSEHVREKQDVW
jgi:hypothetical protein